MVWHVSLHGVSFFVLVLFRSRLEAFSVTSCETDAALCKPEFDILNSNTIGKANCTKHSDFSNWPSLDFCCPIMRNTSACVLRSCLDKQQMQVNPAAASTFTSEPKYSKAEATMLAIAAPLCDCLKVCRTAVQNVNVLFTLGEAASAQLIINMTTQGYDNYMVKAMCQPDGWACLQSQTRCTDLLGTTSTLSVASSLIGGLMNNCAGWMASTSPMTTESPMASVSTMTTASPLPTASLSSGMASTSTESPEDVSASLAAQEMCSGSTFLLALWTLVHWRA